MVVQGEVTAGDDIDTGVLLDLPVSKTQALGLGEEVSLGELAAPVCSKDDRSIWGRLGENFHSLNSQASVAFFRSRFAPMRGKPRIAD